MRKQTHRDHRHMSKMELEVRRQKAAADRKSVQVRYLKGRRLVYGLVSERFFGGIVIRKRGKGVFKERVGGMREKLEKSRITVLFSTSFTTEQCRFSFIL